MGATVEPHSNVHMFHKPQKPTTETGTPQGSTAPVLGSFDLTLAGIPDMASACLPQHQCFWAQGVLHGVLGCSADE